MPQRQRAPYAPESRQQMIELVRSGRDPEQLAREFEPSAQAIRNWVAQADRDGGRRDDGLTTVERDDPPQAFGFVRANQAMHAVRMMCRLLGVSPSGFYAWRRRSPSARAMADAALSGRIRAVHEHSRGNYGAPSVRDQRAAEGQAASRKRIARLMQDAGLAGISRRRRFVTTRRDRQARPAPDLVDRNFAASGRDQLWVADITYIPTWAGFLYLAVVLDAWSRRVVGWAMATHLRTELVLEALNMALTQRRPSGVIHHSDQGTQYHVDRLRPALPAGRSAPVDGFGRRLFRQRHVRELLRHARVRAAGPPAVANAERGPAGGVRFPRGVVQPPASPLGPGLSQPRGVRKEARGCMRLNLGGTAGKGRGEIVAWRASWRVVFCDRLMQPASGRATRLESSVLAPPQGEPPRRPPSHSTPAHPTQAWAMEGAGAAETADQTRAAPGASVHW